MKHFPTDAHCWKPLGYLALAIVLGVAASAAAEQPSNSRRERPVASKPLLAHWTFDEPAGNVFRDASGRGCDAVAEGDYRASVQRTYGVFGGAIGLPGRHLLRVPAEKFNWTKLAKISFSVWAAPTQMATYSELFRKEDGHDRVLFSFQDNFTHLSLGLNVGGCIECDAPIDPSHVLDGRWHHCAATFDGRVMRVYLDGRQIGALDRPGAILAGGPAPGCIGSMAGEECFQGTIDDLRIYADALSGAEIAAMYHTGVEQLARSSKEIEERVNAVYVPENTFARTLAGCRKRLAQLHKRPSAAMLAALIARLKTAFPQQSADFAAWTETNLVEFISSTDPDRDRHAAERLVDLLLEYQPLTGEQWRRQMPDEVRKWHELDVYRDKLEQLKAQGLAARNAPAWIDLILEVGGKVQFRPRISEAVAPYVEPSTPPTRDLTAAEAKERLRQDWLFQADNRPSPERIKREIGWTRRLAQRITASGRGKTVLTAELGRLDRFQKQANALKQPDAELYFQVREIKRVIALRNPAIDFNRLLLVDMPFPQGSEWPHQTRHRLGYMAVSGARLLVLEGLSPGGRLRQLMPQAPLHGSFWRPDLSFDARKVVFCFKPHNEKSFHLYEINTDGSGLVQLTDGPYDDLDPIYLPDGHILFSTTRGHSYVRCMPPTNAFVLARCDRDGRNIYLISSNNEPDYLPAMMNDGRVIYTRWEYTDKPVWRMQKLWTVNPDGTHVATFWGNQSVWPDVLKDARGIPGSRRVLFVGSAHHNWFAGSLGIIDPDQGFNFPQGLTKITADVPWPETGNGPVDPVESPEYHTSGGFAAYYSPYPLSREDFLVSAQRGGKFLLYLMDVAGNRELIYEGVHNVFHAMPLKTRPRPPVIPDRVIWPSRAQREHPADGVLFSGNVYQNAPPELKSKAKYLRVLHTDPKTYTYWYQRPYVSTGPVVSAVQSEAVKRFIGTVPIEPYGSVAFYAPPGKSLHFQLLDENLCALQTMRSFTSVMPGEYRGCLGCHESHSRAPLSGPAAAALACRPRHITPPPWSDDTVSYPRYVQPVLDRYCGKCHEGSGEARKVVDLSVRPAFHIFCEPYLLLIGRPTWGQPYQRPAKPAPGFGIAGMLMVEGYCTVDPAAYSTSRPMTRLSYKSRLIELCASGRHYDVKVDPVNLHRLIVWIDAMCPFYGDEEVRALDDPVFQGVDWLAIRPRIRTAPRPVRPGPVDDDRP
jgi:hypothetical protein